MRLSFKRCGIRSGFSELEAAERIIRDDKVFGGIRSGFSELEAVYSTVAVGADGGRHPQRILGA